MKLLCFVALFGLTFALGCSQDTAKTRDEAAKTACFIDVGLTKYIAYRRSQIGPGLHHRNRAQLPSSQDSINNAVGIRQEGLSFPKGKLINTGDQNAVLAGSRIVTPVIPHIEMVVYATAIRTCER